MWNGSISLPIAEHAERNRNGFKENVSYEFMGHVPANFTNVTRKDEILASQKGYSADRNVEIMACNYSGQSFLMDETTGEYYNIRRVFRKDRSMMLVLTCELWDRGEKNG